MKVTATIWQHTLELETDNRLFSPKGPDAGTMAMLEQIRLQPGDRILDLGCGYGLAGIAAARVIGSQSVVMLDLDPVAVALARQNAISNGCQGINVLQGDGPEAVKPDQFSLILLNPPYHTDFSVAKRLIEQSYDRLRDEGRLVVVVKRLVWYRNKMTAIFGGVKVTPANGYFVLTSVKARNKTNLSAVTPDQPQIAAHTKSKAPTHKHLRKVAQSHMRKRKRIN